jgi:hypothetical protein
VYRRFEGEGNREIREFSDILADSREFEDLLGYQDFVSRVEKYGLT